MSYFITFSDISLQMHDGIWPYLGWIDSWTVISRTSYAYNLPYNKLSQH